MRKILLAAAALAAFGAGDRAQAFEVVERVLAGYDASSNMRRCQYFDPSLGQWVSFWVPGSCLSYRAPAYGYDGRSHYERRYRSAYRRY